MTRNPLQETQEIEKNPIIVHLQQSIAQNNVQSAQMKTQMDQIMVMMQNRHHNQMPPQQQHQLPLQQNQLQQQQHHHMSLQQSNQLQHQQHTVEDQVEDMQLDKDVDNMTFKD